jgi:hypothetical protein
LRCYRSLRRFAADVRRATVQQESPLPLGDAAPPVLLAILADNPQLRPDRRDDAIFALVIESALENPWRSS